MECYQLRMKQRYPVDDELFIFVTLAADDMSNAKSRFRRSHRIVAGFLSVCRPNRQQPADQNQLAFFQRHVGQAQISDE